MSRLPIIRFRELERILFKLAFEVVRQKGSHVFFRHPDGRSTTVPNHQGRDIARPLLREILREIEITPDQFQKGIEKEIDNLIEKLIINSISAFPYFTLQ